MNMKKIVVSALAALTAAISISAVTVNANPLGESNLDFNFEVINGVATPAPSVELDGKVGMTLTVNAAIPDNALANGKYTFHAELLADEDLENLFKTTTVLAENQEIDYFDLLEINFKDEAGTPVQPENVTLSFSTSKASGYNAVYMYDHGKFIKIYAEADASKLPWGDLDVDIVLECTGFYTSKAKSQAHIDAGAKKVLISAPAGNDLPTIVFGTNDDILTKEDTIVSGASCTTNCLAPMTKALNDYKPIQTGFMTTIHAYTGDQMILDGPQRKGDLRRARAGAVNIVPNSTGAAKAIGLVIPELAGKLTGNAMRVPVPSGSITILDAIVKDDTDSVTVEAINAAMKAAVTDSFGYTEDEIVSSDIIGMSYGSLFDATQTVVMQCAEHLFEVRVTSWYDNEMSYVSQLVRTLKHMVELG